MKKISILYENMQSCKPSDYYTDVISPPQTRKVRCPVNVHAFQYLYFFFRQTVSNREVEIQTEDEQVFLARQQQLLMQSQTPGRSESPLRTQTPIKPMSRTPVSRMCIEFGLFCYRSSSLRIFFLFFS